MVLNNLYKLYHLLQARGADLPRMGWSVQKVSFRVVITPLGDVVRIEDARMLQPRGAKGKLTSVAAELMLPGEAKPSGSGVNPCFLWDNAAYLLGCKEVKARAYEYFAEFRRKHLEVETDVNSPAYSAVCRFLEKWTPDMCANLFNNKDLYTGNGVFRIIGTSQDVHQEERVVQWWQATGHCNWRTDRAKAATAEGMCLVTGKYGPVAALHEPSIKGVTDAQSSGAKLVSFNCKSFESYGKEQSFNSPVSPAAAFAYCNALNYLLASGKNRLRIGDATTVFWTDAPKAESALFLETLAQFSVEPAAQDENLTQHLRKILEIVAAGKNMSLALPDADSVNFHILGLSPNAARLSVRFYHQSTFGEFVENMAAHYRAMCLQRRGGNFKDPEFISPYQILRETARESKDVPPSYGGALMRAILFARPYPDAIATAMLRRMRVDYHVNYVRCSYLKAWLIRKFPNESITTMLDNDNTHPGYLLGRTFAILQKTQSDALHEINRTLQEAYYASASTSPRNVFPRILKLHRHHMAKLPVGIRIEREKLLQHVLAPLTEIPARLNLSEQSYFALGFYHQTQDFYSHKESSL
ncbi:MAG: type I-C CRISPR-associated protein Cas8c/Csd1 [Akkermansiaceae bacterium]|nr:type I-C CRISPR-associated protein Cas8c/Csd1 [Akkermansiaceae bacterium]